MFVFPSLCLCFFNLTEAFPLHRCGNLWHFCAGMRAEPGPLLCLCLFVTTRSVTSPRAACVGHSNQLLAEVSSLLWACRAAQERIQMPFVKLLCFIQSDFNAAAVISLKVSQIPYCLQGKASLEPLVLLLPWQGCLRLCA